MNPFKFLTSTASFLFMPLSSTVYADQMNLCMCPGEPQVHTTAGEYYSAERTAWLVGKTDQTGAQTSLPGT